MRLFTQGTSRSQFKQGRVAPTVPSTPTVTPTSAALIFNLATNSQYLPVISF